MTGSGDSRRPIPATRSRRFARTSRWAMTGSGDEEGAGDLGRREAAGKPQRERDLRLGRERRVAAGEDELEAVVGQAVVGEVGGGLRARLLELRQLQGQRAVAPEAVEGDVPGRRDDPGGRLGRHALDRPPGGGACERLLHGLLGQVGVAEPAPQGPTARAQCSRNASRGSPNLRDSRRIQGGPAPREVGHRVSRVRRARSRIAPSTMKTAPARKPTWPPPSQMRLGEDRDPESRGTR